MFTFWKSNRKQTRNSTDRNRARLAVEALETRLVPYSASTNAWPAPQLITISFVPDGTVVDSVGDTSNLFSTFNAAFGSTAAWENAILKAAQQWAQQTNINFAVVNDNGTALGLGNYQQGDPNMGDIRISGNDFGSDTLAQAYMPPPVNNTSYAGDIEFNTGQLFSNNGNAGYDLFTVATHEFGHSLGLYHSSDSSANMYADYTYAQTGLVADDIAGIQSIYSAGAARSPDSYDTGAGDHTYATAPDISSTISTSSYTAQLTNLNINSTTDVAWYKVTLPAGSTGGLTVAAQSSGVSLLEPKLTLYSSNHATALGTAGSASYTGGTATVHYASATAGQTFYIKVQGYDTTAFGTGAYELSLTCGTNAVPAVTLPNTQLLDGSNPSFGGGQAIALNPEFQVNTTSDVAQTNSAPGSVAMDTNGNYVVVWSSQAQDGSGSAVYAQRYNAIGVAQGGPFQVNTYTQGDKTSPAVAMDPAGDFVITWSSNGQDGSGWGVYAQRYNADGTANGSEFQVNTTTTGDQRCSSVAMDAAGNFVITWSSNGQDGSGWGVYAQRYNADGTTNGSEFQVNTYTQGDQMYSSVAMDAAGNFIITWSSNGQDGGGWGVYAQRYNADGTTNGSEFQVNTTTTGDQTQSAVAVNPATGDFVITWAGNGQTGSWGIYAQLYSSQGVAQGSEFLVSTTATGNQMNPGVGMDANGNFTISWTNYNSDGSSAGIFGQQYSATGVAVGNQFGIDANAAANQQYASLAMDSLGDVVVVWTGNTTAGTTGVFGQRYLLNGASGLAAMTASDGMLGQGSPALTVVSTPTSSTPTLAQPSVLGAITPSDALFAQGSPVLTVVNSTPSSSVPLTQSTGHKAGCTCPLCQRLAQALGMASANAQGAYATLPVVSPPADPAVTGTV